MEHVTRHWFNGKPGRMARRDIKVIHTPERWEVEARQGGPDGESRRYLVANEAAALELANRFMQTGEQWRDLTDLIGAISPIHEKRPKETGPA